MSETVHYKGKLKLVPALENETVEDRCKRILNDLGFMELESWCDSWKEYFYDELYQKYAIVGDDIFQITLKEESNDYEMFNVKQTSEDEYDYEVMYYNGCMGLEEAIQEGFDKIDET